MIEVTYLDERMVDLTIDSPAVGLQHARLLLPHDFQPDADDAWPVLYLLHGLGGKYTAWTEESDVAELTEDINLLIVMPDADSGWYTDWWNEGEGGPPMWETFHLTELRQLLERNWQAGDDRAVAGLSMGGFGAISYAGRHPEMFKAAASFSGVLDIFDAGVGESQIWGNKTDQADIYAAHDPVSLAPALAGMPLYISYGNGEIGPLDADRYGLFGVLEEWVFVLNETFIERLQELGIEATVDNGPGTHSWPYFEQGLHRAMPILLEALGI
jgi:S-formylglutathione hydrolase FrmB